MHVQWSSGSSVPYLYLSTSRAGHFRTHFRVPTFLQLNITALRISFVIQFLASGSDKPVWDFTGSNQKGTLPFSYFGSRWEWYGMDECRALMRGDPDLKCEQMESKTHQSKAGRRISQHDKVEQCILRLSFLFSRHLLYQLATLAFRKWLSNSVSSCSVRYPIRVQIFPTSELIPYLMNYSSCLEQ